MNSREIGGYFQWELGNYNNCPNFTGILLNSGRNSLEYILRTLKVSTLWIPRFTCDTVLETLNKLGITYSFYPISEALELGGCICLKQDEYLLYTNYFGLKDEYVNKLLTRFGECLIVDNSQALYCPHSMYSFYSPRKFVGIPDGGIAFSSSSLDKDQFERDYSFERCSHLLKRYDLPASEGYTDFRENSLKLKNQPIKRMSALSESILKSIDFDNVKKKRLSNFHFLHSHLGSRNCLFFEENFSCPLVYPFYVAEAGLREMLISNKIYVPTYWPNVFDWNEKNSIEYKLSKYIIPIPIDQRYDQEDMDFIANLLKKNRYGF